MRNHLRGLGAMVRPVAVLLGTALTLLLASSISIAGDPNICDSAGDSPDVIVGEIDDIVYWGSVGDTSAFSISTWSCNVGTCQLDWISNTNEHPVIAQNMFRLKNGRFEQVGQSWLKHGFFALSLEFCETGCVPTDGRHLGVNCADPYTADLNGSQPGLGPKSEVNPTTGFYPYPFTEPDGPPDTIFKRLQVQTADLRTSLNADAKYYVEGQYVTPDDAAAGNDNNNASYREISVDDQAGFEFTFEGPTQQEQPAIAAWVVEDPGVLLGTGTAGEGRYYVASRATPLGNDLWRYEYAVQNLNSHRSAGAFRVPVPTGATLQSIGFHDVDYHSGEPYDDTDWSAGLENGGSELVWRTDSFAQNANANALRWGTLYNFWFVADVEPDPNPGDVTVELWRPGALPEFTVKQTVPNVCNGDGVCDDGEGCVNCPTDCLEPGESCCGDLTCDGLEDGCDCPGDCGLCFAGGAIPSSASGPENPLRLARTPDGSELQLSWDPSCQKDDVDYAVYRGLLGNFSSYQKHVCSTGGSPGVTLPTPSFSAYYLIAPSNGKIEGSLGFDSQGQERSAPPELQACYPRQITTCDASVDN